VFNDTKGTGQSLSHHGVKHLPEERVPRMFDAPSICLVVIVGWREGSKECM